MTEACIHWWIIEEPHGRTSPGVCKHCGAVAEFPNTSNVYDSVRGWEQRTVAQERPIVFRGIGQQLDE